MPIKNRSRAMKVNLKKSSRKLSC